MGLRDAAMRERSLEHAGMDVPVMLQEAKASRSVGSQESLSGDRGRHCHGQSQRQPQPPPALEEGASPQQAQHAPQSPHAQSPHHGQQHTTAEAAAQQVQQQASQQPQQPG
ncbi:hypothetical protein TSOC_011778, partial [Tetrabaena socialis]